MSVFSGHHFLGVRNIELRIRRLPKRAMLDALDNSDYGRPLGRIGMFRSRDAFSNWIFARPVSPSQLIADDHDRRRTRSIALIEIAPAKYTHAQRREVARTDLAQIDRVIGIVRRYGCFALGRKEIGRAHV